MKYQLQIPSWRVHSMTVIIGGILLARINSDEATGSVRWVLSEGALPSMTDVSSFDSQDFNGDSLADVVVYSDRGVEILLNDGAGRLVIGEVIGNAMARDGVVDLYRLERVSLLGNQSEALTIGRGFGRVEELVLTGANLRQLKFQERLPGLRRLDLFGNRLEDWRFLRETPNVRVLNLGGNGLREYEVPIDLRLLEELIVLGNPLEHLRVPEGLAIDRVIGFPNNRIETYRPPYEIRDWTVISPTENLLPSYRACRDSEAVGDS